MQSKPLQMQAMRDKIRGSMLGGAIGDALGYPVEFLSAAAIVDKYGADGITAYEPDAATGNARISDDTQMTLFTANGILVGATKKCLEGMDGTPHNFVSQSYQDWLITQEECFQTGKKTKRQNGNGGISWLLDVPELYHRRAPGNTCLSALQQARTQPPCKDYMEHPRNNSKGCGGIMRIAPLGLHFANTPIEELDTEAAVLSAITHGHPLGYLPSAVLTHILHRLVYSSDAYGSLKDIIVEARDTVCTLFRENAYSNDLRTIMNHALALAANDLPDCENLPLLGEGWVAEETLAIAIYCAIRYAHDFSGGIIAAVNHNGDSDSTGAVVGNILGAINGYHAIAEQWKQNLELSDVILELADDLCHGCPMGEPDSYQDAAWIRKYVDMHWKSTVPACIFFWHEDEEYGYLSNWYPSPFVVDDFCYDHVEQYLMAQKAKQFHDAERYTAILKASSPKECKALGRKVTPFDNAVWENVRYEVLLTGIRAKFTQNQTLQQALLATGDRILAEASPFDGIFGIQLAADVAASLEPSQWRGRNLLGKALMAVREELRGGKSACVE